MASRYANLDEYYATLAPAQQATIHEILTTTLTQFPNSPSRSPGTNRISIATARTCTVSKLPVHT